jgi:hypothetical protein
MLVLYVVLSSVLMVRLFPKLAAYLNTDARR